MKNLFLLLILCCFIAQAQVVEDDFEGSGTITSWYGDDCLMNTNYTNPYQETINTSATVLQYNDVGGTYANVQFEVDTNFDLTTKNSFSLKIYVPSSDVTGSQTNQISLKLQDKNLVEPWSTQSEIIKPITLDEWQEVTFDFENDSFVNLDPSSLPPILRTDFNKVVIQVNGENNSDFVIAYLDDIFHFNTESIGPVYDNLVWSDEFDTDGAIDDTKWHHQTQIPSIGSWYNGEIQHYTDRTDNSYVSNGFLHLLAKKETFTDQNITKDYTSARLNSKYAFTYGKVEISAKLPFGVGTWPAIWMLGKNINEDGGYWDIQGFGDTSWPACGEIDIMEHWGDNQNYSTSALHTPSSFGNTINKGGQTVSNVSSEFHVYTVEWSPEKIIFKVDDVIHYIYNPAVKNANTWPFDTPQYLLLNVAILPSIIDTSFTESDMVIDYIRVYNESTLSDTSFEKNNVLKLYPNPIIDDLNITLSGDSSIAVLKVYNTNGRLLLEEKPQQPTKLVCDVSSLKSGFYIVNVVFNNGENIARTFVKK